MAAIATHRSPLAARWYPGETSELKELLASVIQSSTARTGSFVRGGGFAFLVPHAAPSYSGAVAASAFRHAQATAATRVVILGFSHKRLTHGVAVPEVDQIETPLGTIRVDRAVADALAGSEPFHFVQEQTVCDHSVEIQIPYIQTLLPGATIVPLYVGHLTADQRVAAARNLCDQMDAHTVLVASSDLTHYGRDFGYLPFGADESTADNLRVLDTSVLTAAGSLDPLLFGRQLGKTGATVCGAGAIQLLLETVRSLKIETFQETLDYDTSGAMMHDYEHSVSYGAAGYFPVTAYRLELPEQAALLERTCYTLDRFLRTGDRRSRGEPVEPALQQRGRVFVTLHEGESIRGCVGCFETPHVLAECAPELALAAYEDDRFGPIKDPAALEIEIHLLTPPKRITDLRNLRTGEHGAFLKASGQHSLLLPVVAQRCGLTRDEFLKELAHKAGVPEDIYSRGDWELSVFRDQSFRESGMPDRAFQERHA